MTRSVVDEDLTMIAALAAYQLRYGQAEEAMALAQLAHFYRGGHGPTLMLMARALAAIGDWDNANILAKAAEKAGRPGRAERLFAAMTAFAANEIARARRLLGEIVGETKTSEKAA